MSGLRDAWLLAAGTFTAMPVAAPSQVDAGRARVALMLAPAAALPLGLFVTAVGVLGARASLPPLAVGLLAVAAVALATRVLHWDGLSDVADGLTASHDRERSLQVMKSGTAGPAGVIAVVLVAGLQVAGMAPLLTTTEGAVTAGVAVVAARWALLITCARGVPAARPDGLGAAFAGAVPRGLALVAWLVAAALLWVLTDWRGAGAAVVAVVVVALLTWHAIRRLGGVTGDVYGAAIELAAAVLLIGLA